MSQQINLFNPIFLKQKKYFAALTMAQALAMILLVCVLCSLYAGWQLRTRQHQASASTAQVARLKAALAAAITQYPPRVPDAALDTQLQRADSDVHSLQRIFETLEGGGFGDTKGYSVYFRSFARQIVDGLWLTGVNINGAGQQIDLMGRTMRAGLVPEYLRRLGREPEMKSKTFSTLDMQVPNIEMTPDAEGKPRPPAPAPYIEFDVRSLETHKKNEDKAP